MRNNLKRLAMVTSLSLALITPIFGTTAAFADSGSITRGEFIKLITDQLKLSPTNKMSSLPKDVQDASTYANSVRVMLERKIMDGYEDGTFRLEQPITKVESSYILGRFLGIEDSSALSKLQERFGVKYGIENNLSSEAAKALIQTSLHNDAQAVSWIQNSSKKQAEITSFRANLNIEMNIFLKPGTDSVGQVKTVTTSSLDFNKSKGIHQLATVEAPGPKGPTKVEIDQYTVTEGTYIRMPDPATSTPKWLNMSKQIPFSFDQIIALQQKNQELSDKFVGPYFFYRDLGTVDTQGSKLHMIEMNGKLANITDLLKMLGSITNDQNTLQSIANSSAVSQMSMLMSGTFWFDEKTMLLTQMDAHFWITYGEDQKNPIDRMEMSLKSAYKDYNQTVDIQLPEEAKKAEELPAIQLPSASK